MKYTKEHNFKPIDHVKYCGASGDFNPIHTVPQEAKEAGYADVIVPGLMTMGIVYRLIENKIDMNELDKFDIRFSQPIYPNESLSISYEEPTDKKGKVQFAIANKEGVQKARGSMILKQN